MLMRLLTQRLRHCSFCLRGAYVDSPYAIGLRKLAQLRVSLTQASYDTTPSTHIKGGLARCSHGSFERSGSTWTKFQTQCNLWKRKKTPVSCKLSDASRINSLFCLCLIPKLSKSMAQPDCCCRLTQAEINGIVASGCVWRPPSLHEIILIPYVSISTSCSSHVFFEIWFYLNQIPNSVQPMKTEKNARLIQVIWRVENKQPFLSLSDSQALQINGATGLLLQVDTGWDKWHCG